MYSSAAAPSGYSSAYSGDIRSCAYTATHQTRLTPVTIAAQTKRAAG